MLSNGESDTGWHSCLSADGERALLLDTAMPIDRRLHGWDARRGRAFERPIFEPHKYPAMRPDGRQFACLHWIDTKDYRLREKNIKIYEFDRVEPLKTIPISLDLVFKYLCYSPDGSRLAAAGGQGAVWVWEVATGRLLKEFRGPKGPVRAVAILPGGIRAVSGGWRSSSGRFDDMKAGRYPYQPLEIWDRQFD